MLYRERKIEIEDFDSKYALEVDGSKFNYKKALFFDLEHYIYRKPITIGVFGCCYYDEHKNSLVSTQYMIESKGEARKIVELGIKYFKKAKEELGKEYIVTFSGNNDFLVMNYLIEKYKIDYEIKENFKSIDLQKEFEKSTKEGIGLKDLEVIFDIERESEVIKGSNIARTFGKLFRDKEVPYSIPKEKQDKIMFYNEQDVVSLFYIYVDWFKKIGHITKEDIELIRQKRKEEKNM